MTSVAEKLRLGREKSKKRKELLGHTLGPSWAEELRAPSGAKQVKVPDCSAKLSTKIADKKTVKPEDDKSSRAKRTSSESKDRHHRSSMPEDNTEEFRDSTAFLKGTQSQNPHNDYSQNFVDTGQRPQNFISTFYSDTS